MFCADSVEDDDDSCAECGTSIVIGENDAITYPGLCNDCEETILGFINDELLSSDSDLIEW